MLRDGAITVWEDAETHFGYSPLEAMQSGSLVIAKTPDNMQEWMEKDGSLRNCCVWFDDFDNVHKIIASVVRSWVTNNIPSEIEESAKDTLKNYLLLEKMESKTMSMLVCTGVGVMLLLVIFVMNMKMR